MNSIVTYDYDDKVISKLEDWQYGNNWPIVYMFFNNKYAYVGQTLDAIRRTSEHMEEDKFDRFDKVCFISNKSFNKSVALDLEAFLIKYVHADGRKLINGNFGVVNHNYFYKEAYEDDFKEIWQQLKAEGIVKNSLIDISNSELYKYSPYKSLNREQLNTTYDILKGISGINNSVQKSIIEVIGGAGTGKTILAVYLVKLLKDIRDRKEFWKTIDDPEDADRIMKLMAGLTGINEIGFVVPMVQLRDTMKNIFDSVEGLSKDMIYAPEEVYKKHFDLLVVDEAHRLYKRKNLPGSHLYSKFDKINRLMMAEKFTKTDSDYTELDWVIQSSRIQILFYDDKQAIRTPDIGKTRFEQICRPRLFKYYELTSQMRCKGGNGYYEYIKDVLFNEHISIKDYKNIENYKLKLVDSIADLQKIVSEKNAEVGLSKMLTGPGWSREEEIVIDNCSFHWVSDNNDDDKSIYSIHKIQGFDLNYAGVIFGREIYYDADNKRIKINKKELKDNHTKSSGDSEMKEYILNIYLTLMTRGILGTYVYVVDDDLREYLRTFIDQ